MMIMENYPFIYIGHGDYFEYTLTCYVKFKENLSEDKKNEIKNIIPKNFNYVEWLGPVLRFHDSCIGGSVKNDYEPGWWNKVEPNIIMDKDLAINERPVKKSWDRFADDFNKWVIKLNSIIPIDFFVKGTKMPKTRITDWNKWSISKIESQVFPLVESYLKEERNSAYVNNFSELFNSIISYYLLITPQKAISEKFKEKILKLYLKTDIHTPGDCYGEIYFSLPVADQNKMLDDFLIDPPHVLLNAIKDSKKSEEFLADNERFYKALQIIKKIDTKINFISRDIERSAIGLTHIDQGPEYIREAKKHKCLRNAKLMELSILIDEENDSEKSFEFAKKYIQGSSLYCLANDINKAVEIVKKGIMIFGEDPSFIELGIEYSKSLDSEKLIKLYSDAAKNCRKIKSFDPIIIADQTYRLIISGKTNEAHEILIDHFINNGLFDVNLYINLLCTCINYQLPDDATVDKIAEKSIKNLETDDLFVNYGFMQSLTVFLNRVKKYQTTLEVVELYRKKGGVFPNAALYCNYTYAAALTKDKKIVKKILDELILFFAKDKTGKEINQSNIKKEVLDSDIPVLLEFFSTSFNSHDLFNLRAYIKEVFRKYEVKLKFGKCNIEENKEITEKYTITNIPLFLLVKDGNVVNKIVGADKNKIIQLLEEYIPKSSDKTASKNLYEIINKDLIFLKSDKDFHILLGNIACLYALLNDKNNMLEFLKLTKKVHPNFKNLKPDKDFKDYRNDPDFLKIFE